MSTDNTNQGKNIQSNSSTNPAQKVKAPQLPTKLEFTYEKEKDKNTKEENNQ